MLPLASTWVSVVPALTAAFTGELNVSLYGPAFSTLSTERTGAPAPDPIWNKSPTTGAPPVTTVYVDVLSPSAIAAVVPVLPPLVGE